MIEAMACGTPVVAFNRGSVPEIINDGVTGYIVEDEVSAVAAVSRLDQLSRKRVRSEFVAQITAAAYGRGLRRALPQPRATQ